MRRPRVQPRSWPPSAACKVTRCPRRRCSRARCAEVSRRSCVLPLCCCRSTSSSGSRCVCLTGRRQLGASPRRAERCWSARSTSPSVRRCSRCGCCARSTTRAATHAQPPGSRRRPTRAKPSSSRRRGGACWSCCRRCSRPPRRRRPRRQRCAAATRARMWARLRRRWYLRRCSMWLPTRWPMRQSRRLAPSCRSHRLT